MSSATTPSIVLSEVGLVWPDGTAALTGLTGTFGAGRTGLVGLNGCGKSTLLRLVAGELRPTTGSITTLGDVARLPHTITLHVGARVADLLGIRATLDAVRTEEVRHVGLPHPRERPDRAGLPRARLSGSRTLSRPMISGFRPRVRTR